MNYKNVRVKNMCTIYIDDFVSKPFVGKFLRVFCLYLNYLQLNLYGVATAYYAFELIGIHSLPNELRNVTGFAEDIAIAQERFERWANFMGLEFSLIGLLSAAAMMHGVKTLQKELMIPWIVFHILFIYLNFLKENIEAIIGTDYSTTTASFVVLKLVFFIIIVLTVGAYYRKMHLDHQPKQEDKKKSPAPLIDMPVRRRCLNGTI